MTSPTPSNPPTPVARTGAPRYEVVYWAVLTLIEAWVAYALYEQTHASPYADLGALAICAWGVLLMYLSEAHTQHLHQTADAKVAIILAEAVYNGDSAPEANRSVLEIRRAHAARGFMSLSLFLHIAIIGFGVYLYYRS